MRLFSTTTPALALRATIRTGGRTGVPPIPPPATSNRYLELATSARSRPSVQFWPPIMCNLCPPLTDKHEVELPRCGGRRLATRVEGGDVVARARQLIWPRVRTPSGRSLWSHERYAQFLHSGEHRGVSGCPVCAAVLSTSVQDVEVVCATATSASPRPTTPRGECSTYPATPSRS